MNPIDQAIKELLQKSRPQIQVETAMTWAYRACAAKRLAKQAKALGDIKVAMERLIDAEEYAHEALEHGALAGDGVLASVRKTLECA